VIAIGVKQDQVRSHGVGDLEGLLGVVGFDRRGAAQFKEHP
jgi:hypothetical protein